MAEALTDAAVVYGAQRYFDGVHNLPGWPYAANYSIRDDELLFLEFLHNILLYDKLYLDKSSLEHDVSRDLRRFIEFVNRTLGFEWIVSEDIGSSARVNADASRHYFCELLLTILDHDPLNARGRIQAVPIPWAYVKADHDDHSYFASKFRQLGIPPCVLPFAIYTWRALTYGAMANYKYKENSKPFAYVAAPGRLTALKAMLDRSDIKRFTLPRDLLREIRWGIPQFPSGGFDFTYLKTIPFFVTSPITNSLSGAPPKGALIQVCSSRRSLEASTIRDDWNDVLFEASNYAAVGGVYIQILKNVSGGPIVQNQCIRANPSELDDIFVGGKG